MGKTWALVGGLIILTGALLYISVSANKNPKPIPQVSVEPTKEVPQTILTISDEERAASGSSLFKSNILIDSKTNEITGAQIELLYDPTVLTKVDITPGDFLKDSVEVLKKINPSTGRISYVLGTKINQESMGSGVLATITYLRLSNKATIIDFLPETLITAQGFSHSALLKSESGNLGAQPTLFQNYSTASSTIR